MHLLTALVLRKPGPLFKFAVIGAQGTCRYLCNKQVMCYNNRMLCHNVLDNIHIESTILSSFCWLFRRRSSKDLHTLYRGIYSHLVSVTVIWCSLHSV